MLRNQTRVHQRVLGLVPTRPSRHEDATVRPDRLIFPADVQRNLREQLYATGELRGGPLFGHRQAGEVTIIAAPLGGYRILEPSLATDPLSYNPHYLLGWVDSLNQTHEQDIDWVGSWIMWPNSLPAPLEDQLAWLRVGRTSDLINPQHCLCALAWSDGVLSATVYTWDLWPEDIRVLSTNL